MKTAFAFLLSWFRTLPAPRRTLLLMLALCTGGLALSWFARPMLETNQKGFPGTSGLVRVSPGNQRDAELKAQWERIKQAQKTAIPAPAFAGGEVLTPPTDASGYATPMIVHAAELSVATKEFTHSRSSLEEILERHHGYAAKLRMVGQPAASSLTATLRVPSSEFSSAVNDLKTLGKVEQEEQTADEITQRRADVEARLINAQSTLERLQTILAKGGKIQNLLEVQRQLANVREEVARLEAERVSTDRQATFAQVLFSLREEVTPPAESMAAEFRAAAIAGFSDALSSLSAILLFVISRGPVTLLWVVVVFFPSRWMWRKWHPAMQPQSGEAQSASAS